MSLLNNYYYIDVSDLFLFYFLETGIPKDREEVNRREVWVCDG
jgi:hypothetical protein